MSMSADYDYDMDEEDLELYHATKEQREAMSTITGLVTKVNVRTKTKQGKPMRSPAYSIQLDDEKWVSLGFDSPSCTEGDVISIDVTSGGYGLEGKSSSIQLQEKGAAAPPAAKKAHAANDDRQRSIVFQSSLNRATDLIPFLVESGAVKLPKVAEQYDFIMDLAVEMAYRFTETALNPSQPEETAPTDE